MKQISIACLIALMLGISSVTASAGDLIVHPSGSIIIRAAVHLDTGSFVVEPGGNVDMDLTTQVIATNFSYGGILTVASAGAAPSSGQSFQLFKAPTYSGAFTMLNLPTLGAGLAWADSLLMNGSIIVGSATPPIFTEIALQSGSVMGLEFTGLAGQNYNVLATTNPTLPLASWTKLGAATEITSGHFQFGDNSFTNFPRRFYQVQ